MDHDGGYTRSYRRKWKNSVFRNLRDAAIWSWMCDTAAWRDTSVRFCDRVVDLKRGQLVTSERFIAEGFCVDRQVVRRLMATLEQTHMIALRKTHGGTVITVCNYDKYQPLQEDENPPKNPGRTQGEPRANPNKKEGNELNNNVPYGTNAGAFDLGAALFGPCLSWLAMATDKHPDKHRSTIGRWRKEHGDTATLEAFMQARRESPSDPVAWIMAFLQRRGKHGRVDDTPARRDALAGAFEDCFGDGAGGHPPDRSEGAGGEAGTDAGDMAAA